MNANLVRSLRYGYLALIALFLLGVLAQAYFAGRMVFSIETVGPGEDTMHAALGWPLAHMVAPVVLLLSLFLGGGRNFLAVSVVWGAIAILMPTVAMLDEDGPHPAEAFHPVLAMLLLALTLWLTYRAWAMVAETRAQGAKAARAGTA